MAPVFYRCLIDINYEDIFGYKRCNMLAGMQ